MSRGFQVVIPARYASTRLPGKPLADIGGAPMIVRVAERAAASGAADVVVATDDERVREAVTAAGFEAVMTRPDHPSGSDRVMEVAELRGWTEDTVVVNVQGDEPLIPPAVIAQVAELLHGHPEAGVATLCEPVAELAQVFDPNVVKAVADRHGRALYFSRAPVPYARDLFPERERRPAAELLAAGGWRRHVGIYGFRLEVLRRFVTMPTGTLERLESLEQLRLLEHGIPILLADACAAVPGGVDTPADLDRARARFAADG